MKKTLGGERLGNGKKIKVDLHGWGRSTFDISRAWRSTMTSGTLVPCFVDIATNGTTYEIDINTMGHTIPTTSPLFGSFKMQVDFFACPIRLYQGLLHNNAINIGLEMNKVLLPNITLGKQGTNTKKGKTNPSSLNNYLGIRGYHENQRTFSAIPHLAYYDIFKQYYANKQEENAFVITQHPTNYNLSPTATIGLQGIEKVTNYQRGGQEIQNDNEVYPTNNENYRRLTNGQRSFINHIDKTYDITTKSIDLNLPEDLEGNYTIRVVDKNIKEYITNIKLTTESGNTIGLDPTYLSEGGNGLYLLSNYNIVGEWYKDVNQVTLKIDKNLRITNIKIESQEYEQSIKAFPLENIDKARREILKKTNLLERININEDLTFLPYSANIENELVFDSSKRELQGLVLKTYQNDIFNTWVSTDFVDTINGLSSIAPDESGKINMDSLILAKKVYNILNRIAISGGTYEDWQESVYGEDAIQRAESPIYIGGKSAEIAFQEVVSTAGTEEQPLATLGGKGVINNEKGGKIIYKANEPSIIMGIVSITPRVDYHQGNKWYMTDLDNMDNLHKPGLDGIGFQNLIANNVIWSEGNDVALAKQPAWMNYQTAVNEVFGYFAEDVLKDKSLYNMTLRRNYETDENGKITDFTSYIDPSKYNYAFTDNSLTAQNFWIQLGFKATARRKMAATEIPNL